MLYYIFLFLLMPFHPSYAYVSLMEEPPVKKITPRPSSPKVETAYYLSGIIYKNPSSWSLWINKELFSFKNPPPFFNIKTISDDFITFFDQNKKEQTLSVNQTYKPG